LPADGRDDDDETGDPTMRFHPAFVIAPTLLLLGPVAPAAAQPAPAAERAARPDPAAARARVAAIWEKLKAEGFTGAVRIDLGDETLIADGAGFADPTTRRPWTAETQFEIGSLVKPMTAAGIMKLADAGKLKPTDPLSRFFPEAPARIGAITLHQLMTHTSGLPEFAAGFAPMADQETLDRAAFLTRLWKTELKFEPGRDFLYSNLGYSVLAAVIEKVTGEDYETWMKREVLAPGGATHTGYRSVFDPAGSARTRDGASISDCCWAPGAMSWNLIGNGGFVSTLDDFVRWRKAYAAGKIVSLAAVGTTMTNHWPSPEGPGGEGYGWIIGQFPSRGQVELAAGGNNWFTTEMRYYPEYGITTLVTTNARGGMKPGEVAGRLVRAAFGEPDAPPQPMGVFNPFEAALLDAFIAALADPDAADRRAFISANAGPVFRELLGLEAIVARFDAAALALKGATATGRESDGPGEARLRFRTPDGGARVVLIEFGGTPQAPRIAGFELQ